MSTRLLINLREGIIEAEGDDEFVRSVYQDFRERIDQPAVLPQAPTRELEHLDQPPPNAEKPARRVRKPQQRNSEGGKGKADAYKPKVNTGLNTSGLETFYDKYKPANNGERILVFAIFLRDHLSIAPCTADDIYTCFFALKDRIKIPEAFAQAFYDTQSRTHFIEFKSIQEINITIIGDNYFSQKLKKKEPQDKDAAE